MLFHLKTLTVAGVVLRHVRDSDVDAAVARPDDEGERTVSLVQVRVPAIHSTSLTFVT